MDSVLIEVALGLALIYLVFSLSVTSLNEALAALLKLRGKALRDRLEEVFQGKADFVLNDPLLSSLSQKGLPSYIPPKLFGEAFAEKVKDYAECVEKIHSHAAGAGGQLTQLEAEAQAALQKLPEEYRDYAQKIVERAHGGAKEFLDDVQRRAAQHFDEIMDRASGGYARKMKLWSAIIAALLVAIANVDTIQIANQLVANDALRVSLADQAQAYAEVTGDPGAYGDPQNAAIKEAVSLLPIGWNCPSVRTTDWPNLACELTFRSAAATMFGWALSALAIMLGAPFWFGVLQKVSNIRGSGGKPEKDPA